MKRIFCGILAIALLVTGCCSCAPTRDEDGKILIVASFYPVYIFTLNLVDGIDGVEVQSMAQQNVGCLHDYTLTARDVKLLDDASLFVMNGAGMEGFIEDVYESVAGLKTVDSSAGIELLCNDEHAHSHEEASHSHNHSENAHIWLSIDNAVKQIENIKNGICEEFPELEEKVTENFNEYIARLEKLAVKRDSFAEQIRGKGALSFHGAYEYLAEETGLVIIDTIESDEGGEPSAKELAHLTNEINEQSVKALFIEPYYEGSAAEILQNETNAKIYILNPVTSGDNSITAYEDIMNENYETILKAVK